MEIRQVRSVYAIVLGWNRREDTIECLASLQDSDFPDLNLVLVDNHSEDDTVAAVRQRFPQVHIIENDRNLGFAEGNNVGIQYAVANGADYIFLLNNDARVQPNTIALLVQAGLQNPEIGMLSPGIQVSFDQEKLYVGFRFSWEIVGIKDVVINLPTSESILDTDFVSGSALLVKSQVVRQIGLLDPDYFAYMEDVDWSIRCRGAGYRVVIVPQARATHDSTGEDVGAKVALMYFLFVRNQFLFLRKHNKWSQHRLSFLKHSIRKSLERYQSFRQAGAEDKAEAVIDGWWAGLTGQSGAPGPGAPRWLQYLVRHSLGILLWLTGWLYFQDYRQVKRQSEKGMRPAV